MQQLNISCPINFTGYGLHCKHTVLELVKHSVNISLFPISQIQVENEDELTIIKNLKKNQLNSDQCAPSLRIFHQFDLMHHVGRGLKVGFTVFELDKLNELECKHINGNDLVITASEWGKRIIDEQAKVFPKWRVKVVPLGVDTSVFHPNKQIESKLGIDRRKDTFVILNVGKCEVRKGHDIIIDIFNKAFSPKDDVRLILMNDNPFLNLEEKSKWTEKFTNHPLYRKVSILGKVSTQNDLAQIMNQVDCGFFPARAEGWNLELLEMMACEKPVVCLNYSGHSEYINSENSFSIVPKELEPAHDGKWFFGQGNWAKIGSTEEEFFVESLRTLYKSHKDRIIIPQAAPGLKTAQEFTWTNSVDKLITAIDSYEGIIKCATM